MKTWIKLPKMLICGLAVALLASCATTDQRLTKRETSYLGAEQPAAPSRDGGLPSWDNVHAGYLPGYAASHGCVWLPSKMAQHFFNNVSVGTPVTVIN